MLKLPLPCFLVAYCCLSLVAMAAEFNVTFDDTHSSISYLPVQSWSARISYCHTSYNAYNHTWHEPVYSDAGSENAQVGGPISMSVNFIGTALYLYSLPGRSPSPSGLTFNLDGHSVSSLSAYSTDSPFFAYWNLTNTPHNLIVNVDPPSTFSFDYLITTTAAEAIPLLVQARQAASDNTTISSTSSSDQSSNTSSSDSSSGKTQIGAIAYAIAASIGITSLFSIGLAISLIKIRRQRTRVRRERREQEQRNRSRGLTIHLPPASVSAMNRPSQAPRRSTDVSTPVEPPAYDTAVRHTGRNSSAVPAQNTYVMHSHLATISEVATVLSLSQPSISSRTEPSPVREDSLEGMPPAPPGLGEQQSPPTIQNPVEPRNQSQNPSVRSDHDA